MKMLGANFIHFVVVFTVGWPNWHESPERFDGSIWRVALNLDESFVKPRKSFIKTRLSFIFRTLVFFSPPRYVYWQFKPLQTCFVYVYCCLSALVFQFVSVFPLHYHFAPPIYIWNLKKKVPPHVPSVHSVLFLKLAVQPLWPFLIPLKFFFPSPFLKSRIIDCKYFVCEM